MYKIKCKVHNLKESKIFRVSKQFRLKEMFSDLVIKVYDNNLPIIKYKHFITTQHVEKQSLIIYLLVMYILMI